MCVYVMCIHNESVIMLAQQHSSLYFYNITSRMYIPERTERKNSEYKIQNRKKTTQNREKRSKIAYNTIFAGFVCQFIVNRLCGWMLEQQAQCCGLIKRTHSPRPYTMNFENLTKRKKRKN